MKHTSSSQFMAESGGVGLVTRTFNTNEKGADARIEQFENFVDAMLSQNVGERPLVKRLDVIIPTNTSQYPATADCGITMERLSKTFKGTKQVRLHQLTDGDMFCSMQNYVIGLQDKCSDHIMASPETLPYWEGDVGRYVAEQLVEARCEGARATGVAVNPIAHSVMEGRLANTLMMWHRHSLIMAGLFSPLAAVQMDNGPGSRILYGYDGNGEYLTAKVQGVEEMVPLAFLTQFFGQCLAPFSVPFGDLAYQPPSEDERTALWNMGKFDTKLARQEKLLAVANSSTDALRAGVMNGYGWRT